MPAIEVTHLTKTYRYHQKAPGLRGSFGSLLRRQTLVKVAVASISFRIAEGEVVGFLGANGAGKTTTLKMLSGLLYPSSGSADVLGHSPSRREPAFLRRISLVMGQKNMLWWDIPAMETLLLHKEMYGIPEAQFRRTVEELAALLDVEQLLRVQVRKLSLGERMKMELLTALVHRPAVLFLDEPTIGLDVVSQQRVRQFLRQLNREHGTTVLLTSHYMDDIEALCPRVLLIDHGHLHFDGTLTALVERAAPHKLLSAVFAEAVAPAALAAALAGLLQRPTDDPLRVHVAVPREQVADVAERLLRVGRLADLSIEDVPVEDILRQIFSTPSGAGSSV
ncbi:MAG TPA: ATP-binding cassette domain-containing protein [Chloroflexota bacterium]